MFRLGSRWLACAAILASVLMWSPDRAFAETPAPPAAEQQPPAPPPPPPPPPFREGSAEFAFVGTTGNASTQTIGVGGELIFRPDQWVFRQRTAFVRNESESELTAESFVYLFRAERILTPRLSAFGEYSYFKDRFAGVNHRNSLVGGLAYKFIDKTAHLLVLDAGLGYLNEQRLVPPDVSTATYAFGGAYRWKISETAEFTDEARFTGTFAKSDDWRVFQAAAVTARLTTLLSLKVSYAVRYQNAPVTGFKNTDTNTAIALVAKF